MNKRPSKSAAANSANSSKLPPPPNDPPPNPHHQQSTPAEPTTFNPDSHQSPRRIAGAEQQEGEEDGHDGRIETQQPQRRKRSNEPTKRRESKEKLRKSATAIGERGDGQGGGDQQQQGGMEERLEELRRENNALKHKLEEQIRLNSVIVANPSKGRATETNAATKLPIEQELATMERSVFGSTGSHAEETGKSAGTTMDPPPPPFLPSGPSSSSLFLPSLPSPNGILQKSEPSAFSVICRGRTAEEELIGHSFPSPLDLLSFYPPNFHFPSRIGDNVLAQSEFVRLAAQLTPFSLFSLNSAASQPSSSGDNFMERHQQFINQLYGLPDQGQQPSPIERLQSERMAELSRPLMLETSAGETNCARQNPRAEFAASHQHFPMNEADIGQEAPLDFSTKTAAGVIRSKGNAYVGGGNLLHPRGGNGRPKSVITTIGPTTINRQAELPRVQLDQLVESIPKATIEHDGCSSSSTGQPSKGLCPTKYWANKNERFSLVSSSISPSLMPFHNSASNFCLHPSATSNLALAEHHHQQRRQSVLEIAAANSGIPLFPPSSLFPNLNGCLPPPSSAAQPSLFNPFAHLFLKQQNVQLDCASVENDQIAGDQVATMDSTRKNDGQSPSRRHQRSVERRQNSSPKRQQKAGSSSGKNAVAGPSSSSSSSMSMLGTLLAAPNKRHTSPTVPASRTELCSGLVAAEAGTSSADLAESRRRVGLLERAAEEEKKQQQSGSNRQQGEKRGSSDSEHSSTGGAGPSNSPTNSMDSLHSASPHHHHHHNSSVSSPSSTLPGAGSTVTTICGSDRTRRGSSSPSGNSGCSGDDSLGDHFHHLHKEMMMANAENGEKGTTDLGQNDENGRQSTGGHQKMRQSSGSGLNMCLKMRTSEELERYMDRRRRNNEAAKRCRANRRAVFEYRSRRAQMLEAENGELRQEMIKLNNELDQLKAIIATNATSATRIVPNA